MSVLNTKTVKMILISSKRAAFGVLAAVAMSLPAHALDLAQDFSKALRFDPSYQSALAEKAAGLASASQAGAAYFPQFKFDTTRMPSDMSNRRTATITQPVFDVGNWATMMQSEPRRGNAEATLLIKQQDLALRLLKAANAIIVANENIRLNKAKMEALNQQAERAKRLLDAGQGTVTDLRDIEVKAAQARAQQLLLETQLGVSAKQYAAITGEAPVTSNFLLPKDQGAIKLKQVNEYVMDTLQSNPQILAARSLLKVSELDLTKAKGSLAPTVNAIHSQSTTTANATATQKSISYTGVSLSLPLAAGNFYGITSATANLEKAKEAVRDTEEKSKLEVERLRALVASGTQVLLIQKDAIASAELSVEANTKSYQGGVRSAVDVLNAIQTLYQVKSDYANAVVQQAENLMQLLNLTNPNVNSTFAESSRFLLAR